MPVVVVAAVTTKVKAYRTLMTLPAGQPLRQEGQIIPFQLTTIDQTRLDGFLGVLTLNQIDELKAKLRLCWGL
jgi:mRNA-degrading endonuclease toxin of MazEF toxin-antitoxin module